MPEIPKHLGGGCEPSAPLPTRPRETQFPDAIHLIAEQFGAKGDVKIYDWTPKTGSVEAAVTHLRTLQKTHSQKLLLATYRLVEMCE